MIASVSVIAATLIAAGPRLAQDADSIPDAPERDVSLVFEREVFSYPPAVRRDPFNPLLGAGSGPRFEELALLGIIHASDPDSSVALLTDPDQRIHLVRRNDRLGNTRVVDITPLRVTFVVNDLGTIRRQHLALQRPENHVPR